jgi:demethylmenaquinone methyltransferase / 2-methoxy-6-polyprenyl-1,4-benzoquinol methylase
MTYNKTVCYSILPDIRGLRGLAQDRKEPSVSFGFTKVSEKEKIKLVHDHFDSIADKYDWMNSLLSLGLHHPWKRAAVRMAGLGSGHVVLDACGGTADLALLGAPSLGPRGRIIVYDMNRAMMDIGRRKSASAGANDRVLFVEGDIERIAMKEETFDAVMVAFGIRNLVHPEEGFRELFRVLKKGGCLICLEFSPEVASWFKPFYDFYSFAIMPLLGKVLAGSRKAYTYLPESIRLFPSPGELSETLYGLGFSKVTYKKLTHGIAVIHKAEKRK